MSIVPRWSLSFCVVVLSLLVAGIGPARAVVVSPHLALADPSADDQDDLCIWVHPTNPALSTVITSDKFNDHLFVYDLQGNVIQSLAISGTPGNIDLRYRFPLDGELVDIVVFNNRTKNKLFVYKVDVPQRTLTRIDDDNLSCSDSYGLCLYKSPVTGAFHVFTTAKTGTVRQFRLYDSGSGIAITQVRSWSFGSITEGCVADDQTGMAYFAQEWKGIWKVGAEPGDTTPGVKIARVGDGGLAADVEGLTIYSGPGSSGYIIASSQGNDSFKVYERAAPHALVSTFVVTGAQGTDGIDLTSRGLGPSFPFGLFACHSNSGSPKPILLCALDDLQLVVDDTFPDHGNPNPPTGVNPIEGEASAAGLTVTGRPNPFHAATRFHFQLAQPGLVSLYVVDAAGRRVAQLLNAHRLDAGSHTRDWDGRDTTGRAVPAGVYFYRLETGAGAATGKATVLR